MSTHFTMTGADLKSRREEIGMSQAAMAVALETPLSTYLKWEQGQRRVPGIVNVALAEVTRRQKNGVAP